MEFNQEAQEWIKNKAITSLIGCCCDIANNDPDRFKTRTIPLELLPQYQELVFIISNFSNLFDKEKVVEDYFNDPKNIDSQWSYCKDLFNQYIKSTLQNVRETKLQEILNDDNSTIPSLS